MANVARMSKSKSTTSESSSNRSQKTNKDVTLAKALLTEKGIVRSMFDFTSISQTYRILLTCKEMLAAEEEIFEGLKLPAVCNMDECNELSLYRAMVGTPESRWLQWVDTSEVEELILPESVTDEEMLIGLVAEDFLNYKRATSQAVATSPIPV